jgi:hypothetical protein
MDPFEGVNVGHDDILIILIRVFSGRTGRTYEVVSQITDVPQERRSLAGWLVGMRQGRFVLLRGERGPLISVSGVGIILPVAV